MLKPAYWTLFDFYLYLEEPWKGSVPEVYHKRTTDGSDLGVIDPNSANTQQESRAPKQHHVSSSCPYLYNRIWAGRPNANRLLSLLDLQILLHPFPIMPERAMNEGGVSQSMRLTLAMTRGEKKKD